MKHELTKKLINEEELLQHISLTRRQLRELRFRRKIPYVAAGHRTVLYSLEDVMAALARLEVKVP